MRLTRFAKIFIAAVVLAVCGLVLLTTSLRDKLMPPPPTRPASVPLRADVVGAAYVPSTAACPSGVPVRIDVMAWNAQMGLIRSVGGPQSTANSLTCEHGVNVRLMRQDDTAVQYADMVAFATKHHGGDLHPSEGAPIIIVMGDGGALHVTKLNERLRKVCADCKAQIIGAVGFSRGEDKLLGPSSWLEDPQNARGGYVAVVPGDGDDNLVKHWLSMNNIPCNNDPKTFDPGALNIAPAKDYLDAAAKVVSGYCEDLINTQSGRSETHCVDGASTWTPGDVNIAASKRGARMASIISTKDFPTQMAATLIAYAPWAAQNSTAVANLLAAAYRGADLVNGSDQELRAAAAMSAQVYAEKDGTYWYTYFRGTTEGGIPLGGSAASGFATINEVFGGSTYRATYNTFGNIMKQQLPELLPSFDPVDGVLELRYLKASGEILRTKGLNISAAEAHEFSRAVQPGKVIGHKNWDIPFETGAAALKPSAEPLLKEIYQEALLAPDAVILIDGHTDDKGSADVNLRLSIGRAQAVFAALKLRDAKAFPAGRVRVTGHGMTKPVGDNGTERGRAANRRVEITFAAKGT